jgi:MFS family permease
MQSHARANLHSFYILVITQTISLLGSRMTSVAIGLRVFLDTGEAAPLLLVSFFNELPAMLFNSLAGVWVDRWDRRWVMIVADAGQAVGSLLLMLSFISGHFQLWHLYVVALMQGIFAMFQEPAKTAVVTMLVPEHQRDRANAVQGMSHPLAGVLAPALTGVLFSMIGLAGIVLIDLTTFVVAVAAVYAMHVPRPPISAESQAASGHFWRELAGGFRFLQARPALLSLVIYFTIMNFLLNGPLGLLIPYLVKITGSEALTGFVLSAESLGGFIGAALLAAYSSRIRSRINVIIPAMLMVGVMFLLLGMTRSPIVLALSIGVLIGGLQIWALFTSLLQAKTPPDLQGRVFSISNQLGYLGATTSFLLVGPLADNIAEPAVGTANWSLVAPLVGTHAGSGIGLILLITGVIILLLTIFTFAIPAIRRIESQLPDYETVPEGVSTNQDER